MRGFIELSLISMLIFRSGICSIAAPRIAVIGGGIGGASASHYLSELFGDQLTIDLFEAEKLGGRLATVELGGTEYEAGGAVIHDRNLLMRRFVKLLGMEKRPSCGDKKFGIWNKDEFVFEESSYQIMTLSKLIYRYGLQPFRLHGYISSVLDDFAKIYKLQDEGVAFTNVTGLLLAMNDEFPKMLKISMKDHLTKLGYSLRLIDELVEATLVVNYGQSTDIQSFVGCVSVAGADAALWSVKGGNKDVPKHLVYRNNKVSVLPSVVKKIVHLPIDNARPLYEVHYSNDDSLDTMKSIYDIVIVAIPLTRDHEMSIEFVDFPESASLEFPGAYQSTIATFVHGDLNPKYFSMDESMGCVLSCDPNRTIISSVGNLVSVDGSCSRVWKIFTREPLEQRVIDDMFTKIEDTKSIKWKAYPKYTETEPQLNFKLHDSLYHVNAIEWAASAMEMSAIGGRNVAILAHNEYKKRDIPEDSSKEAKRARHEKSARHIDL